MAADRFVCCVCVFHRRQVIVGNPPACVRCNLKVSMHYPELTPAFGFPSRALSGYEKYNTIRADPTLCFIERVGRPDEKAIAAEQRGNDFMDGWVHRTAAEPEKHDVAPPFCSRV